MFWLSCPPSLFIIHMKRFTFKEHVPAPHRTDLGAEPFILKHKASSCTRVQDLNPTPPKGRKGEPVSQNSFLFIRRPSLLGSPDCLCSVGFVAVQKAGGGRHLSCCLLPINDQKQSRFTRLGSFLVNLIQLSHPYLQRD